MFFLRANLIGYHPDELINTNLLQILPAKHHPAFHQYLREISQTGKSMGLMTTLHKNGSLKIWSYHNTLVTGRDGSKYVVGNSIDVTESHLMEKDLQRTQEMLLQTNQVARVGGWEVEPGQ
ncbi:PAS domain S-box protein [Dyadobacter arcticus]|uniref:PAS domain S-box protein n=1 Tax=Dyadobacter arcticus TaxID=1078754 RepID=UPI00141E9B05|nr:PAS domain S-box protein [Dyadobacter arcticus]